MVLPFWVQRFSPSTRVDIVVGGTVRTTVTTAANGSVSGSFTISDPAGDYVLEADDGIHTAVDTFTIYPPGAAIVIVKAGSTVPRGGYLEFKVNHFTPNVRVTVRVHAGADNYFTTNASGFAEGSFIFPASWPPGEYLLEANDEGGKSASAPFTAT
jgi:hypothetical protein